MEKYETIPKNSTFDKIGYFDDEIDCAILGDDDIELALSDIDKNIQNSDGKYLREAEDEDDLIDDDEIDDIIDSDQDYTDDVVDNSVEGSDADDMIAAERELAFDPFEGDDEIDAVINSGEEEFSPEELAKD